MFGHSFLIDKVLPAREVHLLGGPSGAGKTRLLFGCLLEWQRQGTWLGFNCAPIPETIYLACDRSKASVEETLKSFPDLKIPYFSARGNPDPIATVLKNFKKARFIILDGIQTLTPDGKINDYKVVSEFLCELGSKCEKYDLTIKGMCHATKAREGDRYLNPRQRIVGSVAWGAFTETVMILDPKDPENTDVASRSLFIGPRNAKEHTIRMAMNKLGHLEIEHDIDVAEPVKFSPNEEIILGLVQHGTSVRSQLIDEAEKLGVSRPSADRALESLYLKKVLSKPARGVYSFSLDFSPKNS